MSKNVVICLFASSGYDRAAQGVAGAGRNLAAQLGGSMRAVIVGSPEEATTLAVAAVADTVTVLDQPELADYQPELLASDLVTDHWVKRTMTDDQMMSDYVHESKTRIRQYYSPPLKGPNWDSAVRVVHKCRKSLEVVFDQAVTSGNRDNSDLWQTGPQFLTRDEAIRARVANRKLKKKQRSLAQTDVRSNVKKYQ